MPPDGWLSAIRVILEMEKGCSRGRVEARVDRRLELAPALTAAVDPGASGVDRFTMVV
jgi:hypothetical protein